MKIKFTIFILILYLSIPSVARDFYGAAEVPVVFEATDSYTGFQTQITPSAALSFEKLGEAYVTIGDNIKSTHQISAKLSDGVLKVVRVSPTNAVLPNGTLFNIKLPSTANFSDGTISFSNTILSSTANADVSFPTSTCNVSVGASAPTSITLSDPTLTITDSGNTYIYATVKPIGLTTPVEWTSSDPSVASIICDEPIPDKKNGEVEAKVVGHKMGTATITATCGGKSATCQITVTKTPLLALSFNPSSIDLKLGETDKLNPVFSPANATFKTVTYVSKQPLVATVDEEGNITTHQIGTAEIEGTCDGKTAIARVTVSRPDITSISLSAPKTTITDSETVQVSATSDPIDSQTNLTWSSSNNAVATVDNKGLVSGVARGNVTITASGGGKTASIDITVIDTPAASISLNKTSLSIKTTETAQLTATVLPETTTDKTVTWTSSDTSIATVDATGKITAIAVGAAIITATCGEASATCEVTVASTEAESIVLNMTSVTLKATETAQLTAQVLPETTTDKTVTWTSSDASVATVDATGKITAVAVGTVIITATCGEAEATCEVTVTETAAEKVEIKIDIAEIKVGESTKIEVEVYPATTTDKTVTITSSNPDVVTVDEDGSIIAVGVGEATITVTCGDVTATTTITVLPTPAESIILNQTSLTLKATETAQLNAMVMPETTTDKSVTWTSSDTSVATVDATCIITAVAVGNATITATCGKVSATCEVTVIETAAEKVEVKIDIAEIKVGESTKIEVEVYPATTTDKTVTITSSNPDVVTVDEDGSIIAVGVGEATITVTCGDVTATTTITVLPTPAESITIGSDNVSAIKVKESLQLTATVEPDDTTYPSVEWSSSDTHIATVDEDGLVSAVGPGEVDITAYVKADPQISATYHLTVEALLLGDANDNGEVDVFDVVTIGNYIAEKNPQTFCFVAADIINDNEINVADQNAAICISLGLDYETENNTAARAPKAVSDKFVINTSAATDGNACVSISLDNTIEYSSLQANIIIPEGMTVAKVRAGKRAAGHSIIYNIAENGVLKLVLYSLDNSALPVSDEPIVEISLATNGVSGELTIHDALASNASCSLFGLQPAGCLVNDESSLSLIAAGQLRVWGDDGAVNIINAQGYAVDIYDMGGRRVASAVPDSQLERYPLSSGTYIVSAGSKSFKIIVK